jgi:TetR/AcrR family transcriptional regulator, tetracycline repressor protein
MGAQPEVPVGRKPKLSRARIFEEALVLIDDAGLDGFSMRGLASRLGVDPMSIYHHVPSKSAILDGVVDALIREAGLPLDASRSWQDWVRESAERWVGVAATHPEAFLVFNERNLASPESLKPMEALADALIRGGFEPQDTWEIVLLFANYATAVGLSIAQSLRALRRRIDVPERPSLSPEEFPRLTSIASETTPEAVFRRGLEAMISGFEHELRRARRSRRG